jgi:hypothetical protein
LQEIKKGQIVSKKEFLAHGSYAKEQYEGLLVAADARQDCYNIGVQLDEDRVLVVEKTDPRYVRERIQAVVPQIYEIQKSHGAHIDLQNYTES